MRASNSTHPASTPRTSLDSQKPAASSPSSATSSSSRGSEEEDEGGQYGEEEKGEGEDAHEGKSDGVLGGEEYKAEDTKEETVKYELLSGLTEQRNLQGRIAAMKNTLQQFQDLKTIYR